MNYYLRSKIVRIVFGCSMMLPIILLVAFILRFNKFSSCQADIEPLTIESIKPINFPKKGLLTVWFDDVQFTKASEAAFDIMNKNGFAGAISVPPAYICKNNYLSWRQLQALQKKGWEATVAYSCKPGKEYDDRVIDGLVKSKKILKSKGLYANNIAVLCSSDEPFFQKGTEVLAEHYLSSRLIHGNINSLPIVSNFNLKAYVITSDLRERELKHWIDVAKKNNGWLILVFKQLTMEKKDSLVSIQQFEKLLKTIKHTKIPVVIPTQVLRL